MESRYENSSVNFNSDHKTKLRYILVYNLIVSQKSKEKSKSSGNDNEHDKESNETNYDDEDQLEEEQEVETTEIATGQLPYCNLISNS